MHHRLDGELMPMLNCPECDQSISSSATVCPHCGYPLSDKLSNDEKVAAAVLKRLTAGENIHHLIALVEDESTSPRLLDLASRVGDLDIARRLARNANTPQTVLERLAYLDDKELLVSIAKNPNTSPETLERMFQRIKKAHTNPATGYYRPPQSGRLDETFIRLRALKVAIALNSNTPDEILSWLSDDYDYVVSAAVFGNSKLPKRFFTDYMSNSIVNAGPCGLLNPLIPYRDLSRQFGATSGPSWQVAKNSRMYGFGSERFDSQDKYAYHYIMAMQGAGFPRLPKESIEAIESIGVGFPKEIVLNPAVTLDILNQVFDESTANEVWAARDPKTPAIVVGDLYRNGYGMVRVSAAANPNLPKEVFAERFGRVQEDEPEAPDNDCGPSPDELDYSGWEYHSDWVEYGIGADVNYWDDAAMDELQPMIDADKAARAEIEDAIAVAEYERSEEEQYQTFLENYAFATNPSTPAYALHALAQFGGDIARAVASNPSAPQRLLETLLNDECWDAVIMNPSCSTELLESMDNEDEGVQTPVTPVIPTDLTVAQSSEPVTSPPIPSNPLDDEIPF